jgi:hypothetical protein
MLNTINSANQCNGTILLDKQGTTYRVKRKN